MKHLLFLYVGPFYDADAIPTQGKFRLLSTQYTGDIMAVLSERRYVQASLANFTIRGFYMGALTRYSTALRAVAFAARAVLLATSRHYFTKRYAAIVAPEPLVTGIVALMLSRLTGAKLVVEVNGHFEAAFEAKSHPTFTDRLKAKYARTMIPFVLSRADAVKLLYPGQIDALIGEKRMSGIRHAFPNYVSVSRFHEGKGDSPYILLMGYPWFLKGADVLIKAFKQISPEFPQYSLKVVGYCTDKTPFIELAKGNGRIELCDAVHYDKVIQLMTECSVFVLASRTEGIARVLSEAMASRKPIVASRIGGTPSIIRDGDNGLLFESENVDDLAAKLRTLLGNPSYARQLADNGFRYVHEELSEQRYGERFSAVIEHVTTGARSDQSMKSDWHRRPV